MENSTVYQNLINLLEFHHVIYRQVEHSPEGDTILVSKLRGNILSQAVKAIVVQVNVNKKDRIYYLVVYPGDKKLDFEKVRLLKAGKRALFAPVNRAEELTGCVMGAVPPFSFDPNLKLIADPLLLKNTEIVFNAGRLDRSIYLPTISYISIAKPTILKIVQET